VSARDDKAGVLEALRRGDALFDAAFDRLLPPAFRKVSAKQWTEVEVALEAAEFLASSAHELVLDVGAGVGKFCVIGALSTQGRFHGIERRKELHAVSRDLARSLGIERVRFMHGDAFQLDWSPYTGAYLFNPFQENIDASASLDEETSAQPRSPALFAAFVAGVRAKLEAAPRGFRAATYYGFGGPLPPDFEEIPAENRELKLWVKGG
jgi:SAM-dependent methyltransferase